MVPCSEGFHDSTHVTLIYVFFVKLSKDPAKEIAYGSGSESAEHRLGDTASLHEFVLDRRRNLSKTGTTVSRLTTKVQRSWVMYLILTLRSSLVVHFYKLFIKRVTIDIVIVMTIKNGIWINSKRSEFADCSENSKRFGGWWREKRIWKQSHKSAFLKITFYLEV